MADIRSNLDPAELAKFDRSELDWWDPDGPMRALHAINSARLEYVQEFCTLEGAKVVDVGCGGGLLTEALARRGAITTGIDLSKTALAQAREHAQAENLSIEYVLQDVYTCSQQHPHDFQIITCMELIEHVPDPAVLLRNCAEMLMPGGSLFVSTLNRTLAAFLFAIVGAEHVLGLLPAGTHQYERFIRPSELDRFARDAGLSVTDVRGIFWHPLMKRARLNHAPRINYVAHLQLA